MFIQGKNSRCTGAGGFILGGAQESNPETYKNLKTTDLPFHQGRSFTLSSFLSIPKKAPNRIWRPSS